MCLNQPKSYETGFKQLVSAGAPSLLPPLVDIVEKYLFEEVTGWVAEWSGPHGYDVLTEALRAAKTPLTHGPASLVVQYLKKNDIFGLADLEKAAGGKEDLTKLLGEYESQNSLPLDIDDEMQKNLSVFFDERALGEIPWTTKVTELFSLYWCPAGISVSISERIATKHGQKIWGVRSCLVPVRREYGDYVSPAGKWIQFPNDVFGRHESIMEQEEHLRATSARDFGLPNLSDAVFCIFMKYMCSGTRLFPYHDALSEEPTTYTLVNEPIGSHRLHVGAYSHNGLILEYRDEDESSDWYGIAPVKLMFC